MPPFIANLIPSKALAFELPRLTLADGTVEALKWLALMLMTLDHINKYLLHETVPALFASGRLALPLFGFILAYNLARQGTLAKGGYSRALKRLGIFGVISSIPFIALGGLGWGWWPLNIMAMLFVATAVMYLVEQGGKWRLALAALLFLIGGGLVEFWWLGISMCLAAWIYCKKPNWPALIAWIATIFGLYTINHNMWALVALLLVFAAPSVRLNVPRLRLFFYAYYPAHLTLLWVLKSQL